MAYENMIVERHEGVGVVTLNRPKVLNALSRGLYREIDEVITEFEADDEISAIVFTGAGERAFSAGADIHEIARFRDMADPPPEDPDREWYPWRVAACRKPTIGALNGLCYGGAAVLASSFDMRVGCERTSFKFLAASYGRVNSTWSLPMQVGWPMAKELLLTARVVEAEEAHRIGLLNHLVTSDELMDKALELGGQIAANDSRMVQGIKSLLIDNVGTQWVEMFKNELDAQAGALSPAPFEESFKDFLDRKGRKPEES